jgi:hypothetical protein
MFFWNNIVTITPEDPKKVFYNDMSPSRVQDLIPRLKHQILGDYFSAPTYAAWKDIPSSLPKGDLDENSVDEEMVQMMIRAVRQVEHSAFDVVEYCEDSGHCLMIGQAEWTADALRRVAGEKF